jgi:XTP/dITP diphosphohydrolase
MRLVLASGNSDKLREWRQALPGWSVEPLATEDEPAESGSSFEENARIKARHGRVRSSAPWVVGEDSGIEVCALGGRPGIESARWAADPIERLLAELDGLAERTARYVCAVVALDPEGSEVVASGTLDGAVTAEPRGTEGFGYDPVFVPLGESRTVAELGDAWKARHSHRARAATALVERLATR